ncbi:MAG: universal stress protein [Aequorivita sp.]
MKKILVPTDFSDNAYIALCYVAKLYYEEKVEITILHSFSDEVSKLTSRVDIGRSDVILKQLHKHSDEDGKKLLENLRKDTHNLPHAYEVISTPAPLVKTINKLVATENIDLVVVGTKGRTGAEDVLMGSTTISITKSLKGCPLFIVPGKVEFVIPMNIAFATDYNEFYQISKLKAVTRLVRQHRSVINLIHVGLESELNELQRENLDKFITDLSEYDTEYHFVPKLSSVSKTLHDFIDEKEMDMLALVYHKHTFIKQLFREPVVSRVGKHTRIPTLVIPMQY